MDGKLPHTDHQGSPLHPLLHTQDEYQALVSHQVPGSGVQVNLEPEPQVLPQPVKGDGLQAGPALTGPNLELCVEAAASDYILQYCTSGWWEL